MKSFAAALLISSAVAQNSTASATVANAAQTTGNFFSGLIKDYLGTTAVVQEFTAVAATAAEPTTLTGSAQWDTTPLGLNYVTMNLKLATPASNLVARTNALVYFQIEKPVFPAGTRLLQAATNSTNTTATNATAPVTGTGDFEGHALVFLAPDATYNATTNATSAPVANYNMYSKTSCATGTQNNVFYDKFCGNTINPTVAASAW
jgi:hypothetical protein